MAIASHQNKKLHALEWADKQFWTLTVNPDKSAVLTCEEDQGIPPAITQELEFTDFPIPEFKLYCMKTYIGGKEAFMVMLPGEY